MFIHMYLHGRIYINEILYNYNILFNLFFFPFFKQKDIISSISFYWFPTLMMNEVA